jgi:hypothetical protein
MLQGMTGKIYLMQIILFVLSQIAWTWAYNHQDFMYEVRSLDDVYTLDRTNDCWRVCIWTETYGIFILFARMNNILYPFSITQFQIAAYHLGI